ncbi:MAG: tetratricopeptide repeat protein [Bacteroidia bacterium]|nr:tetratricopeptide repeat protein [Bacteroidia bacterium]MCZ2247673.1 tetratricopeptide repeat protein [Bacteroidia bacterium]
MLVRIQVLILCLVCAAAIAQPNSDELLAKQFYDNGEFDKAALLYEKLYNTVPSQEYYGYYIECLVALNDYKEAERFIKKQQKKNPQQTSLLVDLGYIYKKEGNINKSNKIFNEALSKLTQGNQAEIIQLSQAFLKYKEVDFAIKSLQAGRKLMQGLYPFNMELAEAYKAKADYANMYKEYLDAIDYNPVYAAQIQSILQSFIGDDFGSNKANELRIQLLKQVQQHPDKIVFSDFLVWFLIQQRDFESAFIQAKAVDKRTNNNGGKIINLALICNSNQEYDVAIKCLEYEIQKGKKNPYYTYARTELVNTLQKKITSSFNFTKQQIIELEGIYNNALTDMGYNAQSISLIRGLAHLKAFYMDDAAKAIELLETALSYANADPTLLAECKLELGDIYIFTGEMWEPALLYGQVEKSFKYDAIGQEAKFRNARLSFYKGEFEWAQAQLDVLKGATSKLIANDALELSLLISDNSVDSNYVPLTMYSRADLLYYQNKDSLALMVLDSIQKEFPGHALSDDILFKQYKIFLKLGNFAKAVSNLENLILNYGDDILGDDATFKLAELYEIQMNNPEQAKKLYQDVLLNYPGSLFTVEARKRYRKMRGDSIN